jgi:hypothetical protein
MHALVIHQRLHSCRSRKAAKHGQHFDKNWNGYDTNNAGFSSATPNTSFEMQITTVEINRLSSDLILKNNIMSEELEKSSALGPFLSCLLKWKKKVRGWLRNFRENAELLKGDVSQHGVASFKRLISSIWSFFSFFSFDLPNEGAVLDIQVAWSNYHLQNDNTVEWAFGTAANL